MSLFDLDEGKQIKRRNVYYEGLDRMLNFSSNYDGIKVMVSLNAFKNTPDIIQEQYMNTTEFQRFFNTEKIANIDVFLLFFYLTFS